MKTQIISLRVLFVTLAFLIAFTAVQPWCAAEMAWIQHPGEFGLEQDGVTLWKINYGPELSKPYFHPLALPGVGVLTWESPPDHPWHHALWFSWKYINGVNYWEQNRETGKSDGITSWENVEVTRRRQHSAVISMDLTYHLPGEKPLMTEQRSVTVSPPNEKSEYHMDWTSTFTAGPADVVLDRTPPPTGEGGSQSGGYAGLSVRFAPDLKEYKAVDSDGKITEQAERIRVKARAVDFNGAIDGKETGIAILDHPDNLNAPTPWYIILLEKNDMRYFSPAVIQQAAYTLKAGESFTLRYRVLIHTGRLTPNRLERAYKRFTQPRTER